MTPRSTEKTWGRVALVCDRDNRQIKMNVNGYASRTQKRWPQAQGGLKKTEPTALAAGVEIAVVPGPVETTPVEMPDWR